MLTACWTGSAGASANDYPEEMSGGERQGIAIGRALMNSSDLILADEPTASLNSQRGRLVVQLFPEMFGARDNGSGSTRTLPGNTFARSVVCAGCARMIPSSRLNADGSA